MARDYPRFGGIVRRYRRTEPTLHCSACDNLATTKIEIQFGYMRGSDDEVYFVCADHFNLAMSRTLAFLEQCEAKLKRKSREVVL